MDTTNIASLATLIGAAASAVAVVTGYLLSKRKNRNDVSTAERQQLSADQKTFIDNLKAENETLRARLDRLTVEFFDLKEQSLKDRMRVAELERIIEGRSEEG